MSEPEVRRDVVYSSVPGYRPLSLDLYLPDGAHTLCLFLHGGGWRIGSRRAGPVHSVSWAADFFSRVAGLGLAVASVDYRLSGEATYPAQQDDLAAAVRFLEPLADEAGIGRIALWGASAGAQLAAVHALRTPGIATVAGWYPPTDLLRLEDDIVAVGGMLDAAGDSREEALLGGPVSSRPELAAAASAVSHAHAGAPPFLLVHGMDDRNVPIAQSERLAELLTAAGCRVEVERVAGGSHMLPELGDSAAWELTRRTVAFLQEA